MKEYFETWSINVIILLEMKNDAVEIASQVIAIELERLKVADEIVINFLDDKYVLEYRGELWVGSAEDIIAKTSKISGTLLPVELWGQIVAS